MHDDCEDLGKGVFVMGGDAKPLCRACHRPMEYIRESCTTSGDSPIFREVRVEFQYDPLQRRYRGVAIVRAESIWKGSVYTLYSPLVKTDKRALALAESLLGALVTSGTLSNDARQTVLDFGASRSEWVEQILNLSRRLDGARLSS